ncbi:50S ribosomal protein L29 [Candidatus Woesebacteria bacterium RIFCSPHIGHO2_01_FULL_38_10]|uniref:Large ribosomal subunit protein uL29 n=1 Tax=Candidatus Woesebacteria bacterium RIFCSPLOWO2_01_FULL_39_10b TaxID=1802517 RepID=A0A1F8B4K6_9BACT|nr:MAG: 50S ribosomal protein L29 [Candidatus Woesebacteria bacterium RIFCSPHIGHO2_01_FULL_38_10]OGM58927.1 MAG: 50S ribosomal protein L29 [Candidatus Woesebacteria bacterium RIFCSPLOWO2_01_FULL_39_10b]
MKKKDLKILRLKKNEELKSLGYEKKKELLRIGAEVKVGKEKNLKKVKMLRKNIAQILTLIREKEIWEEEKEKFERKNRINPKARKRQSSKVKKS